MCDYRFTEKGDLKRHMKSVHLNSSTYLCEMCDYVRTRKDLLKSHRSSVHREGMLYQCEFCDHQAFTEDYLTKHKQSEHGVGGARYLCDRCVLVGSKKEDLNKHFKA